MNHVQPVQVRRGVANAPQVDLHLGDGGSIGPDAGLPAGLDDGVRGLEGVERVYGVLLSSLN